MSIAWVCCDDQGPALAIEADSAAEAAQEYVDQGDYGPVTTTTRVNVRCTPTLCEVGIDGEPAYMTGDAEYVTIVIQPVPPACTDGHDEHDWCAPYEVVGGLRENPGVWGHGGGVICREVCQRCGVYRVTDTDAQEVSYEPPDEESLAWVNAQRMTLGDRQ